ncbi:hypothetical protein M407DRAFT_244174 [Tulasnella calospora MUT 4182]|uniref:Uncharacterized protein n=1 Tax=Tulasnella calospora MUT 4182 TaxID=1051891 RepID=A0A0C3Q6U8_9AGAM|nr:hypothetical protein M407DRAFT_244174 [Tulasnella calospora MUT 4182]
MSMYDTGLFSTSRRFSWVCNVAVAMAKNAASRKRTAALGISSAHSEVSRLGRPSTNIFNSVVSDLVWWIVSRMGMESVTKMAKM